MSVKSAKLPHNLNMPSKSHFPCYQDAFLVITTKQSLSAAQVYFAIFAELPKGVTLLLRLRNKIVRYFGFKASESTMTGSLDNIRVGQKAGFLEYVHVSEGEVVSFCEERNMAMWLSVKRVEDNSFVIATRVELRTWQARIYMTLIKPLHRVIAPLCIRSALQQEKI